MQEKNDYKNIELFINGLSKITYRRGHKTHDYKK